MSPRPANSRSSRARTRAAASSRFTRRVPMTLSMMRLLRRVCIPTRTFSRAVIVWKSRMFWKVRPTPRSVIACGGLPVTSSSLKRILPDVGVYTPVSMLKNVVLPAPLGPIRLTIEPPGMVKSTSSTATRPPNSLRSSSAWRRSLMLDVVERLVVDACLELGLPPSAGYQPFGSEQHHQDEDDAEDAELVLRHVDMERQVCVEPVADVRESLTVEV